MQFLHIQSHHRAEFLDITDEVQGIVSARNWDSGILTVFCPHTTAALTINENTDPDVQWDLLMTMNEMFPRDKRYKHAEGNSDAHLKTSLFGPSFTLIIDNGRVQLGTWQGIYFVEWDGPRKRNLWLKFLGE